MIADCLLDPVGVAGVYLAGGSAILILLGLISWPQLGREFRDQSVRAIARKNHAAAAMAVFRRSIPYALGGVAVGALLCLVTLVVCE